MLVHVRRYLIRFFFIYIDKRETVKCSTPDSCLVYVCVSCIAAVTYFVVKSNYPSRCAIFMEK